MVKPFDRTLLEEGWKLQNYSAALQDAFQLLSPYLACFPLSSGLKAWVCLLHKERFPA